MLRLEDKTVAVAAREIFERLLKHSQRIEPRQWRKSQTFWSVGKITGRIFY
jgi:phosphatidylserine/phosphatidylglycerophosphate/cardiolipin synthase-like enzyme